MPNFYAQVDSLGYLITVSMLKEKTPGLIEITESDYQTLMSRFIKTKYENGLWIEGGGTQLELAQKNKIDELKQRCESIVIGGYQSTVVLSSTGKAHIYPTDKDDQLNMSGTANAAQLKPVGTLIEFKTKDTGKYELHTQDEIKAVSLEIYDHVLTNLKKMNDKAVQVMACTTVEAVNSIVW